MNGLPQRRLEVSVTGGIFGRSSPAGLYGGIQRRDFKAGFWRDFWAEFAGGILGLDSAAGF